MFWDFHLSHVPALFAATSMAFGGVWPLINARAAMLEFGFPADVAQSPAAAPVMMINGARTTIIGALMLLFYSRRQYDILDTFMAFTGAYAGLVNAYVVWRRGSASQAVFRLLASWVIAACGLCGLTAWQ